MLTTLQQLLNDNELTCQEVIQTLWSGYGEISRYYSPKRASTVIVKSVKAPEEVNHPRGWHSETGHQRKITSYKVEANFYQHYAKYCHQECYVPQLIAFSTFNKDEQKTQTDNQILIMEDLVSKGFDDNSENLTIADIKAVIAWLANFHALFIQNKAEGLWPVGTYWHLATRQDEFNIMANGPIKQAAQAIDKKLNTAKYQTVIHGDAKLANFCFGATQKYDLSGNLVKKVAAVDFQYVGKGVGVKDLAYFLGSCLNDTDLTAWHDELLDYYFDVLHAAVKTHCPQVINIDELEQEWRQLYCFANADFLRFLQGWSPEHHKINSYLQTQTDLALHKITRI